MSEPLQGTASAATSIARVSYTHDSMIDMLIANPSISGAQLANAFGYSQAWVSRVMNSDAFLARLAVRKNDVVDPTLTLSIDEKLRALASMSIDIVQEKLLLTKSVETGLKALEMTTKALGYGARQQNVSLQQNFVVALPPKAPSAESWAAAHGGQVYEG